MPGEVLFGSGSTQLTDSGREMLLKVSAKLKDASYQTVVAGFTDNVPIGGTLAQKYPSNWELAGARAARVVRLLEAGGVPSERLIAVSFGENEPVASNDDEEGRAQNRRIEIRLRPVE
jgi:chemotaxis protein MotB